MNAFTAMNLINAAVGRHLGKMFPGHFQSTNTKHDHYKDFGYPDELDFDLRYNMYRRNGIAKGAVEKYKSRTWQGDVFLLEQKRDGSQRDKRAAETTLEKQMRLHFRKIRLWAKLAEADRRAMIGTYCGVILRFADGKEWDQEAANLAGIEKLTGLEPIWAKQIKVSEWYIDPVADGDKYGQPKMYEFQETPINKEEADKQPAQRTLRIHPSRVFIWSRDGTIFNDGLLDGCYNDLIDFEKIKGAGGEGFWKNAKAAPVFETTDPMTTFAEMAKAMGVGQEDLHKKMNDQVENYQKGFDQLLMLQGMSAKTLNVTLPSPEHFVNAPLMSIATSISMPVKILVGNQTGERASTEDSEEWDQTVMGRRKSETHPLILSLVEHLGMLRVLPTDKDWHVEQADLTEAKTSEKVERASKMSAINQQSSTAQGMLTFTTEEIRDVMDYEPIAPKLLETPDEEEPKEDEDEPQGQN